jgi:hypothetical protein
MKQLPGNSKNFAAITCQAIQELSTSKDISAITCQELQEHQLSATRLLVPISTEVTHLIKYTFFDDIHL